MESNENIKKVISTYNAWCQCTRDILSISSLFFSLSSICLPVFKKFVKVKINVLFLVLIYGIFLFTSYFIFSREIYLSKRVLIGNSTELDNNFRKSFGFKEEKLRSGYKLLPIIFFIPYLLDFLFVINAKTSRSTLSLFGTLVFGLIIFFIFSLKMLLSKEKNKLYEESKI